jgi:hypothetical protein
MAGLRILGALLTLLLCGDALVLGLRTVAAL